jgi:N-acetyltransferase
MDPGALRPPVVLDGRWVRLVPLAREQLPELLRAAESPEVWTYFRTGDVRSPERMREFIDLLLRRQGEGTDLPFTVLERPALVPRGMTRFMSIDREAGSVEIGGSWLDRAKWRTPLNTEAKYLLLRRAFETEGAHRVEFKSDERNERSRRAIERLGAVREGTLREHLRLPDGHRRSSVYYSILAREWPAVKLRLERALARPWSPAPPVG